MSRLIYEEDAINAIKEMCQNYTETKSEQHPHVDFVIEELMKLPSARPEIIRCKDCKYNASSHKCMHPDSFFLIPKDEDFCSYAERREDERNDI